MRFSPLLVAIAVGAGVVGLAAFGMTKRTSVPADFSPDDFKALLVQSMGDAAAVFGTAEAVERGTFEEAKAVYIQRFAHGAVTLFVNGVNINNARKDLENRLAGTCAENQDFEDLPSRAGIILGKVSYTCTKADEKSFAGYVLMIDEDARVSHLYQVVGLGIPADPARAVVDRVFARLKKDYANWLVV
jgi:hypothetical protein